MEATCGRNWAEVPKELLELILSHLYGEDVRSFHLVCRSWHGAEECLFQKEHNPLVFPVPQAQWLLHKRCLEMTYQFIHPVYPDVRYAKNLCEEAEKVNDEGGAIVRHSKDGWLLMSLGTFSMFFICPFSGIVIELPDLIGACALDGVTFTCAPRSSTDCCVIIFAISCLQRTDVTISTIRLGKKKWKSNEYENNILFRPSYSNPVFLKEMFYCLSLEGNLGVYDHKEDTWTVLEKPPPPRPCKWAYDNHLVEHDGGLMSLFIGESGLWVSVFKLNESDMVWENVCSLGDYALFVSVSTSFATKSVLDMMKNKIFFPWLHNNYPVFYCLETKTFRTYGTDLCENNFCKSEITQQLESGWIEPEEYETDSDYVSDEGTEEESTSEDEEYETNDESGSEEEVEDETNNGEKDETSDESRSEEEEEDETNNGEKIVEIIDMARRKKGASSRPPESQSCPWLMFSHGKYKNIQTFYNIADGRCLKRMLPYLSEDTTIRANCDNWVVITSKNSEDGDSLSCFLIHLTSLDKILLPNLEDIKYISCFLSSSPLNPNCVVAFISWMNTDDYGKEETWRSRIKLWHPNQESWVEVVTRVGLSQFITCDGEIYGIQRFPGYYFVVVDILDNEIQVKHQINTPRMRAGSIRLNTFLIESCGDVFLVEQNMLGIAGNRIRTVQVYKLMEDKKTTKMDWVRVTDIGDRVFFMHHDLICVSCSASCTGLKGNSVYFVGFNQDTHIYRYSLLENRICETIPCPHVVHNIRQSCWLMI